jgi:two-component system, NarL family, nitrate/nitrite response regulator NarL
MDDRVKVAIVEDHPVVVAGVRSWLDADPHGRLEITAVTDDVSGLIGSSRPPADVTIVDLELGGRLINAELREAVAAGCRVVVFSAHSDPSIVMEVLDAGAHAYVAKDEGAEHLLDAVLDAAADRPHVTRSQAKAILTDTSQSRPGLSAQERQALLLWFQGMSKASVGRRMRISENTVRQYINRARMKYATAGRLAPSKDALLARAIEDGIISPVEVALYQSYARGPAALDA